MFASSDMFDAPEQSVFGASLDWVTSLLSGNVAVILCVLAVAFIGLTMLGGQFPIRRAAQVILGCFILLGAPIIATGFSGTWIRDRGNSLPVTNSEPQVVYEREELPPATYNPYARAAVRRD